MNDSERFELLEEILDELQDMISTHIALIEGNKDRRALDNLGLQDLRTIEVQREGGPLRAAEMISETKMKAIILTDWDDRGNRLEQDLKKQLDALCVGYDTEIRSRLRDICIKNIKDVESLDSLYRRLETVSSDQTFKRL